MNLSLKDVWLDYFITRQHLVSQIISGDTLMINGDECTNDKGKSILKFSKQYLKTIESLKQKGFHLIKAKVNFIVYWKKEDTEQETKIILPELYFERTLH
jgi:ATP-dependent DNA helicase RecQ